MNEMQTIPLPEPKGDELSPLGRAEAETRLLARSALVALAAEHRYLNMQVRHFTFNAVNIDNEVMAHHTWDLVDSGRFDYTPTEGLTPTAGAFPMTELEYRLRTRLILPAIRRFRQLDRLKTVVGKSLREQAAAEVSARLLGGG
jgi:hypothetical protein